MSDTFPSARAAIFDLDGTLLDTLGDLSDSVNAALGNNDYPEHSEEAVRSFIGDGAETLIRRAMPEIARDDEDQVAVCLESFKQHYAGNYANRTSPYPGILDTLRGLREKGIPLGILSNKPHEFTRQCVTAFFGEPGELFEVVFGQRDHVPKKPHPAGAIEAAGRLGIAPCDCLYVGDSDVDMQTAAAAGMIAIGVAWGFRSAEELKADGAVRIIDSPQELLAAFEGGF